MFSSQTLFFMLVVLGSFVAGTPSLLAQDVTLPELPQVNGPFTLGAVTDSASGKSHFRYNGNDVPPTMRVRPGQAWLGLLCRCRLAESRAVPATHLRSGKARSGGPGGI
jgi:hypothetical protein